MSDTASAPGATPAQEAERCVRVFATSSRAVIVTAPRAPKPLTGLLTATTAQRGGAPPRPEDADLIERLRSYRRSLRQRTRGRRPTSRSLRAGAGGAGAPRAVAGRSAGVTATRGRFRSPATCRRTRCRPEPRRTRSQHGRRRGGNMSAALDEDQEDREDLSVCPRCSVNHHVFGSGGKGRTEVKVRWLRWRYGELCCWCKLPILFAAQKDSPAAPSIEHVIERAKGGCSNPENVRLAHRFCNSMRSTPPASAERERELFTHFVRYLAKRDPWVGSLLPRQALSSPPYRARSRDGSQHGRVRQGRGRWGMTPVRVEAPAVRRV